MTRVSIVTISFNQAQFLERTILSVLSQDYSEIEYIVVDPGSTDGSRELIERYRSRISKVILRPDRGAADGLNRGFAEATGDIFGFLNSDDVLLPGAISSAARFLGAHEEIDIVSGHSNLIGPDDQFYRRLYSNPMHLNRYVYGGVLIIQPSTFFRRSIFKRAGGFNADNKVVWDTELFQDMAFCGGKFRVVNEFWSGYRIHAQSVTGSKSNVTRIKDGTAALFLKLKGRQPQPYDTVLRYGCRLLRHISHPLGAWERIRRGLGEACVR